MHQIIPQVVEHPQPLEVGPGDLDVPHFREIPAVAHRHHHVGQRVEQDGDAEIQVVVAGKIERDENAGQIGQHIKAQVDAGADVALLGAGVKQPPGDQEVAGQGGQRLQKIDRVDGVPVGVRLYDEQRQKEVEHHRQRRDDPADEPVGPFVQRHVLADLFDIFGGQLLIQAVADDAAHAQLGDGKDAEHLFDHAGSAGDVDVKVGHKQRPRHQRQQQKQQTGPQRVSQIDDGTSCSHRRDLSGEMCEGGGGNCGRFCGKRALLRSGRWFAAVCRAGVHARR